MERGSCAASRSQSQQRPAQGARPTALAQGTRPTALYAAVKNRCAPLPPTSAPQPPPPQTRAPDGRRHARRARQAQPVMSSGGGGLAPPTQLGAPLSIPLGRSSPPPHPLRASPGAHRPPCRPSIRRHPSTMGGDGPGAVAGQSGSATGTDKKKPGQPPRQQRGHPRTRKGAGGTAGRPRRPRAAVPLYDARTPAGVRPPIVSPRAPWTHDIHRARPERRPCPPARPTARPSARPLPTAHQVGVPAPTPFPPPATAPATWCVGDSGSRGQITSAGRASSAAAGHVKAPLPLLPPLLQHQQLPTPTPRLPPHPPARLPNYFIGGRHRPSPPPPPANSREPPPNYPCHGPPVPGVGSGAGATGAAWR